MFKIILLTIMIAVAGGLWGMTGVAMTAVFAGGFLVLWALRRWVYVNVSELETAVVYRVDKDTFARFLTPGRHWIVPFFEQLGQSIPTAPGMVKGQCLNAETCGGIPISIEWALAYKLNPFKITAQSRPKLARSLPRKAGAIARNHVNNCLRHVIDDYSVEILSRPGMIKRLERQVRQLAAARLTNLGFEVSRIMLGPVEMPVQVRLALTSAYEQKVRTDYEAESLARLHKVISQFSEEDVRRLIELERIYKLGQNGVTLMYQTAVPPTPPPVFARNGRRYARSPQPNMALTEATASGLS